MRIGYQYAEFSNYYDVLANFHELFCKLNESVLVAEKGTATLSDSEFDRIMLHACSDIFRFSLYQTLPNEDSDVK